jgi:hypothetical protein
MLIDARGEIFLRGLRAKPRASAFTALARLDRSRALLRLIHTR